MIKWIICALSAFASGAHAAPGPSNKRPLTVDQRLERIERALESQTRALDSKLWVETIKERQVGDFEACNAKCERIPHKWCYQDGTNNQGPCEITEADERLNKERTQCFDKCNNLPTPHGYFKGC